MASSSTSGGKKNRVCCIASAMEDSDATFCTRCGKPLMRCMAFQECGGIVDDGGLCPICVQPHLQIVPGATMQAAVGGSVTVPFDLVNESQVDRPLFVKGLWSREGGDWREERLGWEKLAPGERAAASVTANEIDKPGLHQIEILWAISTQWKTREEHFAYSTSVLLAVPDSRSQAGTSVQVNAEHQKGSIIQVKVPDGSGTGIEREVTAIDMKVTRQDREERRLGLRSIDGALRFPRSARFDFRGFEKSQCPPSGQPVVTPDAMLVFGRAHSRNQGGDTDVRLLVIDQNGQVDESQSLAISRRHFEIFAENDRPILRVAGSNGVRVNGKAFGPDKKVVLQDGDEIGALVDNPAALTLKVSFRRELQRVTEVILQRTPSLPGTA